MPSFSASCFIAWSTWAGSAVAVLGEKMARAMASNGFAIGLYLLYRLLGGYVAGCGGKHYRERSG